MKKILVVDDEELVTKTLTKLLKKSGYEVDIANNGSDALEKVKNSKYDLIISDIRMPDLDGVEVIKRIRRYLKENNKSTIPEILITGYASEENLKDAEKLAVLDYVYKPFDIKDFLATIKKNLG